MARIEGELVIHRSVHDRNGTRMSWSWDVRPYGLYRLLTPVIARVGWRQEQENWGGLKRFLEARE